MDEQRSSLREAFRAQWATLRTLDFKPVFIILSATIIQIVARFHTSRQSFREMFGQAFEHSPHFAMYEYGFWLLGDFLLQFPLVLLLIRFALKETVGSYGLGLGNWRLGLKASFLFWLGMIPLLWIVSSSLPFQMAHPAPGPAKAQWAMFIIYQAFSVLYLIGWEFIWRGYVLFGLEKHFGFYAIFIQMIPFALLHIGSPEIETYAAVAAGIGLGMLAFATRSFWYGVLTHALVLATMDLLGALRWRAGNSGIGIKDFIHIIQSF